MTGIRSIMSENYGCEEHSKLEKLDTSGVRVERSCLCPMQGIDLQSLPPTSELIMRMEGRVLVA